MKLNELETFFSKEADVYVGGSNHRSLEAFKKYIQSKKLKTCCGKKEKKVKEIYGTCRYFSSKDAKKTETRLLTKCHKEPKCKGGNCRLKCDEKCSLKCPYNTHQLSNLWEGEGGYVYILSRE